MVTELLREYSVHEIRVKPHTKALEARYLAHTKSSGGSKTIIRLDAALADYAHIKALLQHGIDGFSIKPVAGPKENYRQLLGFIRQAAKETFREVAVIHELAGPQLSLGDFPGVIQVRSGQSLTLAYLADYATTGQIPLHFDLSKIVKRGQRVTLVTGQVGLVVTAVRSGVVYAEAQTPGMLIKDRELILPDTDFAGEIITPQDRNDLIFATGQDIDYILLGMVQSAVDVASVKQLLKGMHSAAKLIVAVKTNRALQDLDGIAGEADMLLADISALSSDMPPVSVPGHIRRIMTVGQQMTAPIVIRLPEYHLDSADQLAIGAAVSVYAAGPDAVLFDAVEAGRDLATATLLNHLANVTPPAFVSRTCRQDSLQSNVLLAALELALTIGAKAIVTDVGTEEAAIGLAIFRQSVPLVVLTESQRLLRQLSVIYGVESVLCPAGLSATKRLDSLPKHCSFIVRGDIVVVVRAHSPGTAGSADTLKIRMIG
jgi:pyruvate kinase